MKFESYVTFLNHLYDEKFDETLATKKGIRAAVSLRLGPILNKLKGLIIHGDLSVGGLEYLSCFANGG
jgi:hypothetical protein